MDIRTAEVTVKLSAHGRYTWTITTCFETSNYKDEAQTIKQIDQELRQKFPDHVSRGSGRVADLDEE